MVGKRKLWEDLKRVKNSLGDGLWCLMGDFIVVCSTRERKGTGANVGSQETLSLKDLLRRWTELIFLYFGGNLRGTKRMTQ